MSWGLALGKQGRSWKHGPQARLGSAGHVAGLGRVGLEHGGKSAPPPPAKVSAMASNLEVPMSVWETRAQPAPNYASATEQGGAAPSVVYIRARRGWLLAHLGRPIFFVRLAILAPGLVALVFALGFGTSAPFCHSIGGFSNGPIDAPRAAAQPSSRARAACASARLVVWGTEKRSRRGRRGEEVGSRRRRVSAATSAVAWERDAADNLEGRLQQRGSRLS